MSVESVTRAGREAAERRMLDRCRIRRVTGETTDADGRVEATYAPVYEGKCRIVDSEGIVQVAEAGGASVVLRRIRTDIPVGSAEVWEGDVVDVLASVTRPEVVGARGRVQGAPIGTQVTANRLTIQEGP